MNIKTALLFVSLLFSSFLFAQQVNNTEFKTKTLQVFQNLDKKQNFTLYFAGFWDLVYQSASLQRYTYGFYLHNLVNYYRYLQNTLDVQSKTSNHRIYYTPRICNPLVHATGKKCDDFERFVF